MKELDADARLKIGGKFSFMSLGNSPILRPSQRSIELSSSVMASRPSSGRLPELDGIRGVAILAVVIWHYLVDGGFVASLGTFSRFLFPTRLAWSGVDLFFVLSGFLIGGILLDAKQSAAYYKPFFFRRFYRILPLYFVWLAVFLAGVALIPPSHVLGPYFTSKIPLWAYAVFCQNFFIAFTQNFGAGWLGITWSLAIEEQFYLLVPWLVRTLSLAGIAWVGVGALLLAPAARAGFILAGNTYYAPYALLPCRADALGVGLLIAAARRHPAVANWIENRRGLLKLALVPLAAGMALLCFENPRGFVMNAVGYTWIAALYGVLLTLVVFRPGRFLLSVFRFPPLARLGELAYGVYLLHQGVNALVHYAIRGAKPSSASASSLAVTGISFIWVTLLATASWELFERRLVERARVRYRYDRSRGTPHVLTHV